VIATCLPGTELHEVVSQCGISVPPEDSAALAKAVGQLAQDVEMRLELGRCARAYAEGNYERDAILGRVFAPIDGDDEARIPDDAVA